jgi:hypothetical protein
LAEISLTKVSNTILTQPIMIHPMHSLERKRNEVSYDFFLGHVLADGSASTAASRP